MNHNDLEKCFSFINCHMSAQPFESLKDPRSFKAITISRQAGSEGHQIAQVLAEQLQIRDLSGRPWVVFDRNLVERVLREHNLPARMAKFMPEDRISQISDILDDLFGLHPPSWILVRKTAETILHLAELGQVILIGRGANIITSRLPGVFHVRLVGSAEKRAKRLQQLHCLSFKEALKMAHGEDLARRRYVKQFFGKDIDDPLLYHLVVNTDLISTENAVQLISAALAARSLALEPDYRRSLSEPRMDLLVRH